MDRDRRNRDPRARSGRRRAAQKGGQEAQALGRYRGGFRTKIHAVVDALGLPVRFDLGPGQQNDMAPVCDRIDGLKTEQVLADKACDANRSCETIEAQGGTVVIPPRRHRKQPRDYCRIAYRNRWGIEGFFVKLK